MGLTTRAMDSPPTFADRLRTLLASRAMTKERLATKIRRQRRTVSNWVTPDMDKRTEPKASDILAICNLLNVSADYLLGNSDTESGLTPGTFIVDVDAMNELPKDDKWRSPVPRRPRIVTLDELQRLIADMDSLRPQPTGGPAQPQAKGA